MARIAGIDLPREKRVEIGLTYIYGIGRPSATKILAQAGVNPDTRCRDCRKSAATEASVIVKAFRFVVRRQRPTQEPEKVLRELLQTRKNNSNKGK